jgi:hypothetical protein
MPPTPQRRPPLIQILHEDAWDGGPSLGAVLGLAPFIELPMGDHLDDLRERLVHRAPAQPPDLLVASAKPVLQAHDHSVPEREDLLPARDRQKHLRADRLHGLRRERPACGPRAATASGRGVARAASSSRAAVIDARLVGQDGAVGLDLAHQLRGGGPAQGG